MSIKTLSVVIPCHNEQEVLPGTYQTLTSLAQKCLRDRVIADYELVFVNNGSTDSTLAVMLNLVRSDPKASWWTSSLTAATRALLQQAFITRAMI